MIFFALNLHWLLVNDNFVLCEDQLANSLDWELKMFIQLHNMAGVKANNKYFFLKLHLTLMHKMRESGIVMMMSRRLTPVNMREQGPGPVGSAGKNNWLVIVHNWQNRLTAEWPKSLFELNYGWSSVRSVAETFLHHRRSRRCWWWPSRRRGFFHNSDS